MFRTKIRTAAVTLIAMLSFAGASLVPSAAQAQWHTICVGGSCFTHTNYTIGGVSPCSTIDASASKAYEGLLEALQNEKELADQVHPIQTPEEAKAEVEDAEAAVHESSLQSFEWGCSAAAKPSSIAKLKVPAGLVASFSAHLRKATSPSFRLKASTTTLSAR